MHKVNEQRTLNSMHIFQTCNHAGVKKYFSALPCMASLFAQLPLLYKATIQQFTCTVMTQCHNFQWSHAKRTVFSYIIEQKSEHICGNSSSNHTKLHSAQHMQSHACILYHQVWSVPMISPLSTLRSTFLCPYHHHGSLPVPHIHRPHLDPASGGGCGELWGVLLLPGTLQWVQPHQYHYCGWYYQAVHTDRTAGV